MQMYFYMEFMEETNDYLYDDQCLFNMIVEKSC